MSKFMHLPLLLLILAGGFPLATAAMAQQFRQLRVEAFSGQPFGVARLAAQTSPNSSLAQETQAFSIAEAQGRALYPAFTPGRLAGLVRGLIGGPLDPQAPNSLNVTFLFTGDAPFEVTLFTPSPQVVRISPQNNPRGHDRLLRQWWRDYNVAAGDRRTASDVPPLVDTYLLGMLGRRVGLGPVPAGPNRPTLPADEPARMLELLAGTEALHDQVLRDTLDRGARALETTNRPLPAEFSWAQEERPALATPPKIEPLAERVPENWFYVRFGNFDNYLWVRQLMEDYGGDLGRMVTLRGHDLTTSARIERRLALKESSLSRLFGSRVVADVAMVGRDTFVVDGPALGLLFQASSNELLENDFLQQRNAALQREKPNGARLETVTLAGVKVSFLSTPDNAVRSYWAKVGNFHLVTTSRAMAEQFVQLASAPKGTGSIAALGEFQQARSEYPIDRDDSVFAFFSSRFLQGLASPQYRVELHRRLQAKVQLQLVELATLAAAGERVPAQSFDELVRGGYLPPHCEQQPDGSGPQRQGDSWVDSLRGRRGAFLPIPDVAISAITPTEEAECRAIAEYYGSQWPTLDPLVVAIKRYSLDKSQRLERVAIDAHVAPFSTTKYRWITDLLGPPRREAVARVPGEVISFQAVMRAGNADASYFLFGGLRDDTPRFDLGSGGLLQTIRTLRGMPGYLAAWPKPGLLDMLPAFLAGGPPDARGYSQLPLGLWRRQWDAFSALSFQWEVLDAVTPQFGFELAARPAQVRIHVDDLSAARAAASVSALSYNRARETTVGNVRLLHLMAEQFRMPRRDALTAAEGILDVRLVCSLGGEYKLQDSDRGVGSWSSTRLLPAGAPPPAEYRAPVLDWLRAADAEIVIEGERLALRGQIDMQRKKSDAPAFELPSFDFLNPFALPPGKKPEAAGGDFPPPKPMPPTRTPPALPQIEGPLER